MAKIHTLTYNGTKSSDLGVFVSGSGSFDAAEFDVDKYEIPGRNGDLLLSNNRYKNIEITYPAFIPKAFMDKVQNVRNWLRTSKVYARLEDTYDMDHYRLGIPTGVQSFSPENRNDGANFEMTFDCKPQRFLKVGETPETVEADVQTETGEIVTFETVAESPITSASVSLSPIQSLNGYDSPWPGGGGKNKLPTSIGMLTNYGVTYSASNDGSVSANGTATGNSQVAYGECPITAGIKYRLTCGLTSGTPTTYWVRCVVRDANNAAITVPGMGSVFIEISATTDNIEIEAPSNAVKISVYLNVSNGTTVNNIIFKPMVRLASVSDASWVPYSNICPISWHTGAELIRTGRNLIPTISDGDVIKKGVTFEVKQDGVHATGTATGDIFYNVVVRNAAASPWLAPGTYTLKETGASQSTVNVRIAEIANQGIIALAKTSATTFTITEKVQYFSFFYIPSGTVFSDTVLTPQLELGSTATAYEPYQGDTYSVTFPETIYGGSHEFVSGKATAAMAKYTFTGANVVGFYKEGNLWRVTITGINYGANNNYKKGLCDRYTMQTSYDGVNSNNNSIGFNSSDSTQILIRDDTITNTNLRDLLNANPLEVVYPLATPLEYTLSPQQLTTLQGQNVVWGNGTITLTYAEPYNIDNPTLFDARPLFTVTNPAEGDVIMVNGQAITFVDGYTGTVYIDCETMNAFSGAANLNSIIQATDFPVLVPGTNIVTWTGAGECTMTPRWWEL